MIFKFSGRELNLADCAPAKCQCAANIAKIFNSFDRDESIGAIFLYSEQRECPRPMPSVLTCIAPARRPKFSKGACAFIGSLFVALVACVAMLAHEMGAFQ